MENSFIILLIKLIHFLFICFIILFPFLTNNKWLLLNYIFIVSCLIFHWIVLSDECILTLIEQKLTGKNKNETFIGRIVGPIYNISSLEIKYITYFLLIFAIIKTVKIF